MGFNDEYQKLRKKRLEGQNTDNDDKAPTMLYQNKTLPKQDVAPIVTANGNEDEGKKKRTWFNKGEFEDGYQFGDVIKTVAGTGMDLSENLSAGILGMGEKVVDAGAYLVGGAAGLFGADDFKEKTGDFIAKDLYDEEEVAKKFNLFNSNLLGTDKLAKKLLGIDDDSSLLGEKTDALAQSGGQLLGTIALQGLGVPWFVTSGATSFGSAAEGALNEGATYGEAGLSAAISAGAEILTEKLFGGSGLGEKGLINLEPLTKGISSKVVKSLADLGVDMAAEGAEEVVSSIFNNLGSALYKEENLGELLFSEEAVDEYIESFVGGAALGGIANTGKAANSIKTGTDYRTGLTSDEQAVFDNIFNDRIAEQGEKLTKKQKDVIYDQVMRDLERGYISVDDIERILGGDTYASYVNTVNEQKTLQDEYDALYRMKNGEKSDEQIDRQKELKAKLEEIAQKGEVTTLETQLHEGVFGRVKGSRLAESYRETARRGQAFEADLSKYDAKQAEIVKKAIDSGILNNTGRTHEFVDMIAKISADKGVLFDFVNNAKLKESGFAVEGATVNGYFDKKSNTVGVNIDSAKTLDTVVGHEITHVLEGTELYSELQKAVFDYAKAKGEFDGRRQSLAKLYAEEDIDSEMTADLIGEYLFTDEDFVKNLSVQNRNVFQKIYDEIKYLVKVVTAGSKEARELERVKRAFDKAYREGVKADKSGDVKHSLTKTDTKADADYLAAVESGDDNALQEMVDQAAESAGYKRLYYHGTPNGDFTKFKGGNPMWITESRDYAQTYAENKSYNKEDERVMELYAKMDSVLDITKVDTSASLYNGKYASAELKKLAGVMGVDTSVLADMLRGTPYMQVWELVNTQKFADLARKQGYDAIKENEFGNVTYGVLNPTQLKSAELVTRKHGKVIPLSERFNTGKKDIRYSLSDSDGKQLTKGQQEYFKDSKVRDENGNLLKLYHGTPNQFTVFRQGTADGWGKGIYFTDNRAEAENYGENIVEAYLNITNPYNADTMSYYDIGAENTEAYRKFDREIWQARYDEYDTYEEYKADGMGVEMEEIYTEHVGIFNDILRELGYDGIIADGSNSINGLEIVAFNESQAKLTSNENPTGDPDIRYSLSRNTELMDNAERYNSENLGIDLDTAREQRQVIYDFMTQNADRLKLPPDVEGNTAIKNSSYDITEENTTVCIRSMAADALCDAVAEELGRPLTVQDTLRISQDLMNYTDEPECVYCYVATDRRAYREFLGSYYKQMQSAIDALKSGKSREDVYTAFLDGRKDTKNMRNRFAMWERIANGGKKISAIDLASEKMMQDAMRDPEKAAQVKDARAYAQSASWAKKRQGYMAYNGHILTWSNNRIRDLNKHYGLRFYSFSDFSPAFVLENMQQMTDAAARGLKGLAYTKVLDFAEIFAPTGININVSVFGYNQNGTVAQDGMMGADWKGAQELRNKYENVGVTFVATNDAQIEWALDQDWIDVVIPYHLVRTGQAVAKHFGYTNYTAESSDTKGANWKKGDKKTIYPAEHNNDKQTYLAAIAEANLEPRFARWVNHPNYMKLVNETRRSANDTPPMQAVFNVDAAKASLERMMQRGGYFVPIGGDYANMQDIASEIADSIRADTSHSLSAEGEAPTKGRFYGKDMRLEVAPVAEDIATTTEQAAPEAVAPGEIVSETETIAPVNDWMPEPEETYTPSLYDLRDERDALREMMIAVQDDLDAVAPLAQRYGEVMQQIQQLEADENARLASLDDADVPPEVEAPYVAQREPITIDDKSLEKITGEVSDMLGLDAESRERMAHTIQNYAQSGEMTEGDLFDEILENYEYYEEMQIENDEADAARRFIKGTKLYLHESLKSDFNGKRKDGFNAFRREHFGHFTITTQKGAGAMSVDSLYSELSDNFPDLFPADIGNSADMLQRMADVASMKPKTEYRTGQFDPDTVGEAVEMIRSGVARYAQDEKFNAFNKEGDRLIRMYGKELAPVVDTPTIETASKSEVMGQQTMFEEPAQKDRFEQMLEREMAALEKEFAQRRSEMEAQLGDKNAYISGRAMDLYYEISNLKKGVRASKELGYLLDHGFEWRDIKSKLLTVKSNPSNVIFPDSATESVIREMLSREYEDKVYELSDLGNEYQRKVSELEQRVKRERKEAEKAEQLVKRSELHRGIIDRIKTIFAAKGFDFDKVLKNAKNLSTFRTVDNTPQRVMEKSLGYKAGQILADETVNKVAQNETEGIRWLDSYTNRKSGLLAQISKQYHIKPGSKESAAAQMYAEGFYANDNGDLIAYGDAELARDFPDTQTQANIKGLAKDQRIRKIYDDTLAMINESRVRNGYPEIEKLENYFLHFRAMDDTFSRLGLPFNPNDIRAKDLPTDLNGVTADLKPGQPYFASAMHRRGNKTSHDLLGGLERYLTSAKGQIYHIDDIQTLRALRNYIADTYGQANGLESLDTLTEEEVEERIKQVYGSHLSTFAKFLNEEANVIAGKTALIDRGLEGIIGRRGMTFMDSINKQVGANMVGFNVSSSATNFLPVIQAFAKTNKYAFVKGFAQTVSNRVGSMAGGGDNFAQNSPVMIRREGADRFYRTPFQKVADAGYTLMGAVDSISTEIIARAKYNELTGKGMSSEQAHLETDKWVSRLMGDRSLGQMPQLYNSKMLGLVTKFQLEVRNQLDSQFYDTIQEAKVSNEQIENQLERNAKTAAKVASTFFQLAVAQHIFGSVFESIAGYNPAFDIIEVIMTALGLDDDEESEDTVLDNVEQGFLALLEDLPYTSTFTGGRIPISSALPIEQLIKGEDEYGNEKSRLETLGEIAPYYVLPGGYGQIKKTAQGLGMFLGDHPVSGSYTDSGNLRFPVEATPGNVAQAAIFGQWASKNAREYFDNDIAPLNPKQTQEYVDVEMSIQDYWKYRKGLSGLKTLEEKAEYIDGLDLTDEKKNILINNIADREEDIDMSDYDQYGSFGEFDFAAKNPEKYEFFKANGISYEDYDNADEDGKRAYTWAYENPEKYTVAKSISDDFLTYYKYKGELNDITADKDENGESIRGSAKEKKIEYINNLDLDYGQRIILFKSLYNADDTYNADIVDYLNNREDISYDEMVTILTELGFTVKNGNVYWD